MKLIHYKILTLFLFILLVGSAVFWIQNVGLKSIKRMSADEASKKAIAYINDKILAGQGTASLNKISEDKEKGLYKLELNVNNQVFISYLTLDGSILFPDAVDLRRQSNESAATAAVPPVGETVDGEFIKVANQEVCKENGKPIIYFFGSEGCSHCRWEKPILEKVVAEFGDKISFHENIDTAKDRDIFSQYSTGSVPTIVLGCQYYRIGSGENLGETEETKVLTKLIQELL